MIIKPLFLKIIHDLFFTLVAILANFYCLLVPNDEFIKMIILNNSEENSKTKE